MSLNFWLTKEQFKTIQPLLAEQAAWCCPRVRPACCRQAGLVRHHLLSSAGI